MINAKEMTNWKEIRRLLNFLPAGVNPYEPFNTNAGEKEVIRQAGYTPAKTPTVMANIPVNANKGILEANDISPLIISASQVFAIPLTINS